MKLVSAILLIVITVGFIEVQERTSEGKKTDQKKEGKKVLTYGKDVLPIFQRYCLPCHTEDEMNPSQLYLDTYDDMMHGGKHGPPVIPGNPDSSNMIRKISSHPPFGDPMPLKRKIPFPSDTLLMLKEWIRQGAKK